MSLEPLLETQAERLPVDTVEHVVCCHEPTLALCGAKTDGSTDGDDADCVVCLDLALDYSSCPLGPGPCHLAEKQPRRTP